MIQHELTEQQKAFLPHILATGSYEESAKAIGIDVATAKRWMREPLLRNEIDFRRKQAAERIVDLLAQAATSAVRALHKIVEDSASDQHVIKAASSILAEFWKGHEATNLASRMDAIEARMSGAPK